MKYLSVEVRTESGDWSLWCSWVDRATAEGERAFAEAQGFVARVVASRDTGALT